MRIPLISMLTKATDYQDKDLVKDLTIRMPIVGKRPAANTLKKRTRDATAYLERWRAALPAINRANVERVTRDWDSLLAKVAWGGAPFRKWNLGGLASQFRSMKPVWTRFRLPRALPTRRKAARRYA